MILTDLADYLRQHRAASLIQMAEHFDVATEVVRNWLGVWERKGCVRRRSGCEGCSQRCQLYSTVQNDVYEWVV